MKYTENLTLTAAAELEQIKYAAIDVNEQKNERIELCTWMNY